jgi:hypothetical protein
MSREFWRGLSFALVPSLVFWALVILALVNIFNQMGKGGIS